MPDGTNCQHQTNESCSYDSCYHYHSSLLSVKIHKWSLQ